MPALSLKDFKKEYASIAPKEAIERLLAEVGRLRGERESVEKEKTRMAQDATTSRARGALTRKINALDRDIEVVEKAVDHFAALATDIPSIQSAGVALGSTEPSNGPPGSTIASVNPVNAEASALPPTQSTNAATLPLGPPPGLYPPAQRQETMTAPPIVPPGLSKAPTVPPAQPQEATATPPTVPPGLSKAPTTLPAQPQEASTTPPTIPPGLSKAPTALPAQPHEASTTPPTVPPGLSKAPTALPAQPQEASTTPPTVPPGLSKAPTALPAQPHEASTTPPTVPPGLSKAPTALPAQPQEASTTPPTVPPGFSKVPTVLPAQLQEATMTPPAVPPELSRAPTALASQIPASLSVQPPVQPHGIATPPAKTATAGLLETLLHAQSSMKQRLAKPDIPLAQASSSAPPNYRPQIQTAANASPPLRPPPRSLASTQNEPGPQPKRAESTQHTHQTPSTSQPQDEQAVKPKQNRPRPRPIVPKVKREVQDPQLRGGTSVGFPLKAPVSAKGQTQSAISLSPPLLDVQRPQLPQELLPQTPGAQASQVKHASVSKKPSNDSKHVEIEDSVKAEEARTNDAIPGDAMVDADSEMALATVKDEVLLHEVGQKIQQSMKDGQEQVPSTSGAQTARKKTKDGSRPRRKSKAGTKSGGTTSEQKRKQQGGGDAGQSSNVGKDTTSERKRKRDATAGSKTAGEVKLPKKRKTTSGVKKGETVKDDDETDPDYSVPTDEQGNEESDGAGGSNERKVLITWREETRYVAVEGKEPQPIRVRVMAPANEDDEDRERMSRAEDVAMHNYLAAGVNIPVHLIGRARRFQNAMRQIGATSRALAISTFIHQNKLTRCHRHLITDRTSARNDQSTKPNRKHTVTGVPLKPSRRVQVAEDTEDDKWWETYKNPAPYPARIGAVVNPDRIPTQVGGLTEQDLLQFFRLHDGKRYLHCGCELEETIFDFFVWKTAPDLVSPTTGAVECIGLPFDPRTRSLVISLLSSTGFGPQKLDLAFRYNRDGKLNDLSKAPPFVQDFWKQVDAEKQSKKTLHLKAAPNPKPKAKPPKEYIEVDELQGPVERDPFGEEDDEDGVGFPTKVSTFQKLNQSSDDDSDESEESDAEKSRVPISVEDDAENPEVPMAVEDAPELVKGEGLSKAKGSEVGHPPGPNDVGFGGEGVGQQDFADPGGPSVIVKAEEHIVSLSMGVAGDTSSLKPLRHVEEDGRQIFLIESSDEESAADIEFDGTAFDGGIGSDLTDLDGEYESVDEEDFNMDL